MTLAHHPSNSRLRRYFLPLLGVLISLLIVIPTPADYQGPNRHTVESVQVRDPDNDVWTLTNNNPPPGYLSTCLIIHTCDEHPSVERQQVLCGWIANNSGCQKAYRWEEHEINLPEASISASLVNCSPVNGWCTTVPSLHLFGAEPLAGETIVGVEGTRNSEAFFCPGDTCDVPLVEGQNTSSYWALSSYGDSSRMGQQTTMVDTQSPLLSGDVSGTPGENGWWVSPPTVNASASDPSPGSGLVAFKVSINGGGWGDYLIPITLGDGQHTVQLRVEDGAGHVAQTTQAVWVDTQRPQSAFINPSEGSDIWASGVLNMAGASSDTTSGLASAELSLNGGGAWQSLSLNPGGAWSYNWDTRSVPNNTYTVFARAKDVAGNLESTARITVHVDNGSPNVDIPDSWYIWDPVKISVGDSGIGVGKVKLTIHGDSYGNRAYNWGSPALIPSNFVWDRRFGDIVAPIGNYKVTVEAWDKLGNKGVGTGMILIPEPDLPAASGPMESTASDETSTTTVTVLPTIPAQQIIILTPSQTSTPGHLTRQFVHHPSPTQLALAKLSDSTTADDSLQSIDAKDSQKSQVSENTATLLGVGALAASGAAAAYAINRFRRKKTVTTAPISVTTSPTPDALKIPSEIKIDVPKLVPNWVQQGWKYVTERVPHFVERMRNVVSTVWQAVPIFVERVRLVPKTIVEAVPRFVEQVKNVVERVVNSEIVTRIRKVVKTVWETVIERVPVLGNVFNWLGEKITAVVGWINKTVVRPATKWVTETYQEVRTWVEEKVTQVITLVQNGVDWVKRTVYEPIVERVQISVEWVKQEILTPVVKSVQDGWDFITRRVPNMVRQGSKEVIETITVKIPDWARERLQEAANQGRLEEEIRRILSKPEIQRRLATMGLSAIAIAALLARCQSLSSVGSQGSLTPTTTLPPPQVYTFTMTPTVTQTAIPSLALPTTDILCAQGYCIGQKLFTDGGLNIRDGPSIYTVLKESLNCGESVTIVEVSSIQENEGYLWAEVETSTDNNGWVAVSLLDDSTPTCIQAGGKPPGVLTPLEESPTIMQGQAISGNTYLENDTHFGTDIYSTQGNNNIYAPWDDRVVAQDYCSACLEADSERGNTHGNTDEKYNYGYGAMAITEYPYENLSEQYVEMLSNNGIIITAGQSIYILTAHLDPTKAIRPPGTALTAGDDISVMGNSGNSYYAHAHIEIAIATSNLSQGKKQTINGFWVKNIVDDVYDKAGNRVDPELLLNLP